jgi:hypothetical protein
LIATLESIISATKATENATLNMTNTETSECTSIRPYAIELEVIPSFLVAAANIAIGQQATNTLNVTETKVINRKYLSRATLRMRSFQ